MKDFNKELWCASVALHKALCSIATCNNSAAFGFNTEHLQNSEKALHDARESLIGSGEYGRAELEAIFPKAPDSYPTAPR